MILTGFLGNKGYLYLKKVEGWFSGRFQNDPNVTNYLLPVEML